MQFEVAWRSLLVAESARGTRKDRFALRFSLRIVAANPNSCKSKLHKSLRQVLRAAS